MNEDAADRVRDPSERAVYQPSRWDRRLREAAGPCRISTARRDGATTSRSTTPSEANHQVAVAMWPRVGSGAL